MANKIVPVIMSGGKGTRLWPLSRRTAPKQFIQFLSAETLYQNTLQRVSNTALYEPAVIVTNEDSRFLAAEQARQMDAPLAAIVLEPVARNTAAAIAAAALLVSEQFGEDAIMHVLASDHDIKADAAYFDCVALAREAALLGKLATFGIEASEPATGYGYIEKGEPLANGAFEVKKFIEKPNRERAEAMLADGGFLWNSGLFLFPVGLLLQEMRRFCPEVVQTVSNAVTRAVKDADFIRLDAEAFAESPDISIDYAVMEQTENAAVIPSAFQWSDLGSWDAVWKLGDKDADGNVQIGKTTLLGTSNSLVLSHGVHLAVRGLDGVAVIASEDAVYVGRLEDSQHVGDIVRRLEAAEDTAPMADVHPTMHRPWGVQTTALTGDRFEVKRISVQPGKKISLQMHHHRAEHWVVVKGTAEVTIGDKTTSVGENESVYIPQGEVHRLANPGKIVLELIEVRTGSYLGEDDIIRLDDDYGRV
ncbi:mannose-1-phosphate guanylyltransferase/mannose-6-phosphate isomerase [Pararhizobium sp.]|uniref:mannose-1-phosphate guanylyltransferase/mannose-6-phosphate isomerase n=1 Tax=Pararhizobium sp. TaxID=1977563 RepID=UPI002717E367|nr:mannose-1-phosphate guanylyltransferase/mannose-6-phosphate isomerase [Pararhizobium sp.]MDO9418422.1 mannose-1-phosphate guanylyltransferase/mannose-6-phosphate isomerase [Pararhizobium sp.]